jgi:hypothetical protein
VGPSPAVALAFSRDVADRQEVAGDGEEALAPGRGMRHRAEVRVGHVADVADS